VGELKVEESQVDDEEVFERTESMQDGPELHEIYSNHHELILNVSSLFPPIEIFL
jgi:hypothetical protein